MKCQFCGQEITANDKFCLFCGKKQIFRSIRCSACGTEVNNGQDFCNYCGNQLSHGDSYTGQQQYYKVPASQYDRTEYTKGPYAVDGLRGAGVEIRFLAMLIDFIIILIPTFILGFAMGYVFTSNYNTTFTTGYFLYVLVFLAYYILFEGLYGRTPGKMLCGLRVIKKDGTDCNIEKAFIRTLLRIADGQLAYLVGAICVWISKDNQRLGDMLAGTLVVHNSDLKR